MEPEASYSQLDSNAEEQQRCPCVLEQCQDSWRAGHFPCSQPSRTAVHTLWWKGLYKDAVALTKSRPQGVFVSGMYRASAETSFAANFLQPAFLGTKNLTARIELFESAVIWSSDLTLSSATLC